MITKILVLESNPQGTEQLRLNPEIREIEEALEGGRNREQFVLRSKVAVRVKDLQRSLRREEARIVHFCGHGKGSQGLVLETRSGQQQLLDTQAIADLFKLFTNQVECVVLNACYSKVQAVAIHKHINYVIGTKKEIRDDAAIAFSKGFYEALGDGESIERAFEFGCNRIQLEIYGTSKRDLEEIREAARKLVPVYSEAESKWVERPQHEVVELLIKEPLNTIVESSVGPSTDNAAILLRPFIARSPYKGLHPFNSRDKDLFFGRDGLVNKLIEAINQSNFLLVLGASGCGKSSVIRAGVMPQIESLSETAYQSCLFTPNRDPFESFYYRLLNQKQDYSISDSEINFILQGTSSTIRQAINLLKSKNSQSQWLIFIDQLEELFTSCSNTETRRNFIQGITRLVQDRDRSVKLILAMRSDFLEELSAYPQFTRIAQNHINLVADMQTEELCQAIEQPAAKHGVVFESGLVKEMIQDVQGQAGSLPLLQYTLNLLWQNDDLSNRTLKISTYRQLGGVTGALQKHVNQIYQQLSPEKQLATKQIFLRLVDIIDLEKAEVLRTAVSRRAYKSEFTEAQAETVNFLVNQSLLVSDDPNRNRKGTSTVEIAHEALLTSWAKLKKWITDARDTISLNNRLTEDANSWQQLKRINQQQANEELWSGSKLAKVIEFREDGIFDDVLGGLSEIANEFIDASRDWHDRQIRDKIEAAEKAKEAAEKAREESEARLIAEAQAKEAAEKARKFQEEARIKAEEKATLEADTNKKLRQRAWVLKIISLVAVVSALVAVVFGISAFYLRSQSQKAEQKAKLEKKAAELKAKFSLSNETEHLLETLQLVGDNQNFNQKWFKSENKLVPEVQSILYKAVEQSRERYVFDAHESEVLSVAFSPDDRYIVSGSRDNTVKLWDVKNKVLLHIFDAHQDWVNSVAFSPDGKYLVSGSDDKTVKLWDIENQALLHSFTGHEAAVNSVSFNPDGKYLVSGSRDNTVKLWDVKNKVLLHIFDAHQDWVNSVAFSPDGKYLVSGSDDKTVKLWDIENQAPPHTFDAHESEVNSVGFSPDGQYIVSASDDRKMKLWDRSNQVLLHSFDGHKKRVNSVVISSDGQYIVSGSRDETVKLWDVKNQVLLHTFDAHESQVNSVSFSPDGKYIVSGSLDETVKLWDVKNQVLLHSFKGHESGVNSVSFSPDGQYIVSGSLDETVKLWHVEEQVFLHTFYGHESGVNFVVFSPDSQYIVSGSRDKTVKLWHVEDRDLLHTLTGSQQVVTSVGFSPDGLYIVSGSSDTTVKLWRGIGWQDWIEVGCKRIRLHATLVSGKTDSAIEAATTCIKYGRWSDIEKAEFEFLRNKRNNLNR